MDDEQNLVTLVDQQGEEIQLTWHDSFEHDGKTYVVLLYPGTESEDQDEYDGEIMRLELDEHGEEVFCDLDDDELAAANEAWNSIVAAADAEEDPA